MMRQLDQVPCGKGVGVYESIVTWWCWYPLYIGLITGDPFEGTRVVLVSKERGQSAGWV